jgi:hypothetical protein
VDLYLPDEFYALSESPNPRRERLLSARDDAAWLGGEAFVSPPRETEAALRRPRISEPDPIWCVV